MTEPREPGANFSSAPFSQVPWELQKQKLGWATVSVYAAVHMRGWGENSDGCWASTKTIADDAQVGLKACKEALKLLVDHGWLLPVKRPGLTTVYQCQIRPRSNMTQVRNDPTPGSDMTQPPRSDMTHEQEPNNKNPITRESADALTASPAAPAPPPSRKTRRAKPKQNFQPDAKHVTAKLRPVCDLLIDTWQNSLKGEKSERAFKLYVSELEKILNDPNGGLQALREEFDQAAHAEINGHKWVSISHSRWLRFARPSGLARGGTNGHRTGPAPIPDLVIDNSYGAHDP